MGFYACPRNVYCTVRQLRLGS